MSVLKRSFPDDDLLDATSDHHHPAKRTRTASSSSGVLQLPLVKAQQLFSSFRLPSIPKALRSFAIRLTNRQTGMSTSIPTTRIHGPSLTASGQPSLQKDNSLHGIHRLYQAVQNGGEDVDKIAFNGVPQKVPKGLSREEAVDLTGDDENHSDAGPSRTSSSPEGNVLALNRTHAPDEMESSLSSKITESAPSSGPPSIEPPRKPPRTRQPRPRLDGYSRPERTYSWMSGDRDSLNASRALEGEADRPSSNRLSGPRGMEYGSSVHTTKPQAVKQREKALWRKQVAQSLYNLKASDPKDKALARVVDRFRSKVKRHGVEGAVKAMPRSDSKASLQFIINSLAPLKAKDFETTVAEPVKPTFAPSRSHQISSDAKKRANEIGPSQDVVELLQRFKLASDEEERLIQQRLTPSLLKRLAPEQLRVVQESLANPGFKQKVKLAEIDHRSLLKLQPYAWLNDDCINYYGALLQGRADGEIDPKDVSQGKGRSIHYFNSFFYEKLSKGGHAAVKRWTKKVDLFTRNVILFPINLGNAHWTAAAIDIEKKRFEYYDSMGDYGHLRRRIFQAMREYMEDEHLDKKKAEYDLSEWVDVFNEKTPQQDNGSDCGVFSCQTLESIARGRDLVERGFEFKAENMPMFRQLMIWEIAMGKLAKRW